MRRAAEIGELLKAARSGAPTSPPPSPGQHPMVVWLRAVHERATAVARAAEVVAPSPWTAEVFDGDIANVRTAATENHPAYRWPLSEGYLVDDEGSVRIAPSRESVELIVLHDPAAVLARLEAERAVLAYHDGYDYGTGRGPTCDQCEAGTACGCCSGTVPWPCPVWRLVAWGWRHQPGYLAEWEPTAEERAS